MSTFQESKVLYQRAEGFDLVRSFFKQRNVLEVDCPALSKGAPLDLHIDLLTVPLDDGTSRYLHTSPEYRMKRLLAQGAPDIYQLSHVFRKGEIGSLHNPEFTMLEWYRLNFSFGEMIEETLDLIKVFLGSLPHTIQTYRDVFKQYTGLDYTTASCQALLEIASSHNIDLPQSAHFWDKDTLLQLLMTHLIEPHLGTEGIAVLTHFPASQAALSRVIHKEGCDVALRFEIYYKSIELANGYDELTSSSEQKKRFEQTLLERKHSGKDALPMDTFFLEALEKGLPTCSGVAVGFDRLLQLRHNYTTLQQILPFSWDNT